MLVAFGKDGPSAAVWSAGAIHPSRSPGPMNPRTRQASRLECTEDGSGVCKIVSPICVQTSKRIEPWIIEVYLAERVGFEPTCRLPDNTLSRRARYDHFGTSPHDRDRERRRNHQLYKARPRARQPRGAGTIAG
jgi:hypothetical protein